jgi:hypothetical protein
MLAKPFDQINADDVRDLCARSAYEAQLLEFKQELPAQRGRPDPWITGGDFTPYARDRLFREAVAFANAQGGVLVLGIEETKDKPPRAAAIRPLPRIHDLATRMEDAARACIDPVLPGLLIRGIEVGATGEGVLIFRVPASPLGPHRVASDGHAFIRRGASSVQMTMREIQDLTLDLARGAERLDTIFRERASGFTEWLRRADGESGACRITAAPLGSFPGLPPFSGDPNPFPVETQFRGSYGTANIDLSAPPLIRIRPIVRGIRRYDQNDSARVDVFKSGLIDFWYRHAPVSSQFHFSLGWLLGAYLSVLDSIDTSRSMANAPDWEFAIEFALGGLREVPQMMGVSIGGARMPLATLSLRGFNGTHTTSKIEELPIRFPRIPYRNPGDRENVINLVLNDLIDAAGDPRGPPLKLIG